MDRSYVKQDVYYAFIHKCDKRTDDEVLYNRVKSSGINILNLFKLNYEDSRYKSYRLEIPINQREKLYSDSRILPVGAQVKRFKFPNERLTGTGDVCYS